MVSRPRFGSIVPLGRGFFLIIPGTSCLYLFSVLRPEVAKKA